MEAASARPKSPPSTASTAAAAAGVALLVLVVLAGWPDGDVETQTTWFVREAVLDGSSEAGGPATALSLDGFADDFVFAVPARFVEHPDGTATLLSRVHRASDPDVAFDLDVSFAGRLLPEDPTHPPAGSPFLELVPTHYAQHGGPIDPATWRYYAQVDGTLVGRESLSGAVLRLARGGPAAQVGPGASGRNERPGACVSLAVVTEVPPPGPTFPSTLTGTLRFELSPERTLRASDGAPNPVALVVGTHALTLPGIAPELAFAAPARVVERSDGTLTLQGVVRNVKKPSRGFFLEVRLDGRVDPGHPQHPPADAGPLALAPNAYAWNGGDVDPARWSYFATAAGELVGFGAWKGARLSLARSGAPAQLGDGANGVDAGLGLEVTLAATLEKAPAGTKWKKVTSGELCVSLAAEATTCTGDPSPTKLAKDPMHVSMILPGFAEDLVQLVPGRFVERLDGTARLETVLARIADPNRMLFLELELGARVDPGDAGHPPPESPWLGLEKKAHGMKAGPAHPSFWSYFGALDGRLTGLGAWKGTTIDMVHHGVPPQVGFGAAGDDLAFGGTVPFAWALSPSVLLPNENVAKTGEMRFRLDADCEAVGASLPVTYGPDCAPPAGVAPELVLLGVPGLGPVRLEVRRGPPGGVAYVFLGTGRGASPLSGGSGPGCLLLLETAIEVLGPYALDVDGEVGLDVPRAGYMAPSVLAVQAVVPTGAPESVATSKAVELTIP